MKIECVWEHHGSDTLLYAANLPGAYARGENLQIALDKMPSEVRSYLAWAGQAVSEEISVSIIQDAPCDLQVMDADSDVLFLSEKGALSLEEYKKLKALALKSAADFLALYRAFPNKDLGCDPIRQTFYGQVPRTAEEMYNHTKNVNAYYFGEIGIDVDNEGTILDCRCKGFDVLEQHPDFLENPIIEGSYGEYWTLKKMLRRFLWHDRIHAKAMYRLAHRQGVSPLPDPFCFS